MHKSRRENKASARQENSYTDGGGGGEWWNRLLQSSSRERAVGPCQSVAEESRHCSTKEGETRGYTLYHSIWERSDSDAVGPAVATRGR